MFIKKNKEEYDVVILTSLILLPLISAIALPFYIYNYGIVWQEPVLLLFGWFFAGMGITIGYHRLFSHRSFKTYPFVEWILMICGSMALQNSIINWCSDHRRHHKKLDTDDDPYSIKKGFLHAHIGWIVKKNDYQISGVSDLYKKSAIKFQNKYYWVIAIFFAFIVPLLIGILFNRPWGGLIWGGFLRVTLVHHFTFFINSFCHFIGERNYDRNTTARDSWIMALFTFGEGYHNYHHKFQWDYRNGIKWYNFDPSKWIIKILSYFNITYNLRKAAEYNIAKAKINTINERIFHLSKNINHKYKNKIEQIINRSTKYISLWQSLEKRYKSFNNLTKKEKLIYSYKKKIYRDELQSSISSLMLIFINIKNIA